MSSQHLRTLVRDVYSNRGNDSSSSLSNTTGVGTTAGFGTYGNPYANDPYSADLTTRGSGSNDMITIILFIVFIVFSLCLIMMRLSCYYNHRSSNFSRHGGDQHPHNASCHNKIRTKESIEQMLVLKKVLSVVEGPIIDDVEEGRKTETRKTTKRTERRKSNLLLHCSGGGGAGDELDESRSCPICLCDYENGESICWSNNKECFHRFHATCGVAWLAKHSECPVCRAEYLVNPSAEEENMKKDESAAVSSAHMTNPIVIIEEEGDDVLSEENVTDSESRSHHSHHAADDEQV